MKLHANMAAMRLSELTPTGAYSRRYHPINYHCAASGCGNPELPQARRLRGELKASMLGTCQRVCLVTGDRTTNVHLLPLRAVSRKGRDVQKKYWNPNSDAKFVGKLLPPDAVTGRVHR